MKKQLIAKLLVLCMVLAMLPAAALAANAATAGTDDDYVYTNDAFFQDYFFSAPSTNVGTVTEPSKTETPATPAVDVTAPVEVEAVVSEAKATELVAAAVAAADVDTLVVTSTGSSVSMPATALADLAAAGKDYAVATADGVKATVPSASLAAITKDADGNVELAAPVNADGSISVSLKVGNKDVAIEDLPEPLEVEVAVSYAADAVDAVVLTVKADSSEVELEWSIAGGSMKVVVTATGDIRVSLK